MSTKVRLGYEVGTGKEIVIPVRHTAITGITQLSGKTTTLEALIHRSGLTAISFITKRGEGTFRNARVIEPYFRERADWQFVSAVLEATLSEKMKFERAWIMRVSKGAKTLADVQKNVKVALEKAKGLNENIYMTLDAYFDIVIPQLKALRHSDKLKLEPGINVMDLSGLRSEVQALVIQSAVEWVYEREKNTIVIIPEAWKFVPQERNSPVKMAAVKLIREGGGLKNFIWLDSQDIAGVEKEILKQVGTWVLGVQREANEVKRILAHIPAGTAKPKAEDIMHLAVGEFYACFDRTVAHTYVQPEWLPDAAAQQVATGTANINDLEDYRPREKKGDENMDYKQLYEDLKRDYDELNRKLDMLSKADIPGLPELPRPSQPPKDNELFPIAKQSAGYAGEPSSDALRDIVLDVEHRQREINVKVVRETIKMDTTTTKGRIAYLLAQGFFKVNRINSDCVNALAEAGMPTMAPTLGTALKEMADMGFLIAKEKGRYVEVPSMKANILE